eukprot:4677343-Pyramimonas_sp.AAC.1
MDQSSSSSSPSRGRQRPSSSTKPAAAMAGSRGATVPPRRKRPRSRTRPTPATSWGDHRELTMPKPSGGDAPVPRQPPLALHDDQQPDERGELGLDGFLELDVLRVRGVHKRVRG